MARFPRLSLEELSPISLIPEDHCLVLMKSYFDGGNEADSSQYEQVTIATVCGTPSQWKPFEEDWKIVLRKHKAQFLHMTDAVSLKKEFSPKRGWDRPKVDALVSDCVSVVANHIIIPDRFPNASPRNGLFVVTLSIKLKDYLEARELDPEQVPDTITEICASESLGFCFKWGKIIGTNWYHLYYDQGEPFFGHTVHRTQNKNSRKSIELLRRVTHLGESDMRMVPALQLADLFAWCINHNDNVVREWHGRLHGLPWQSLTLSKETMLDRKNAIPRMIKSWCLPKRRPTR